MEFTYFSFDESSWKHFAWLVWTSYRRAGYLERMKLKCGVNRLGWCDVRRRGNANCIAKWNWPVWSNSSANTLRSWGRKSCAKWATKACLLVNTTFQELFWGTRPLWDGKSVHMVIKFVSGSSLANGPSKLPKFHVAKWLKEYFLSLEHQNPWFTATNTRHIFITPSFWCANCSTTAPF